MEKKVEDLLIALGVYPNLSGFAYICKAIGYISKDRNVKMCEIYNLVANDFDTTPSRAERSIRTALSKMDRDSEAYKKYIGIKEFANSAVLYTMAVRLKED